MKRPIAIGLAPNNTRDDVVLALKNLSMFWAYQSGNSIRFLEQWFRNFFSVSYAISFISARAGLYAVLHTLGISKGDEVILQSFTCSVVPHAILETGACPVYTDITDSFTMDPLDLENKITKKTKAIIIQHTFGIAADMQKLIEIANQNNIPVIEDCAHVIGGTYKGQLLGTFGIASIFSFGRDKAFSGVFGGMVITQSKEFGQELRSFQKKLVFPSIGWVIQQLLHPIAFSIILPLYNFLSIGKVLLVALQKLKILSFPLSDAEKKAKKQSMVIKKLPNALATLALHQLRKLKEYNHSRIQFGEFYTKEFNLRPKEGTFYLRFPILVKNQLELIKAFQKKKIYLGLWYSNIIDPKDTNHKLLQYEKGSCPNAEKIASSIINLPTYPSLTIRQATSIVNLLKNYGNN